MLISYPAIFYQDDQGYWVEFLEFRGGTQGETLEEALKNAHEMLESVLATYIENGMALPKPSQLNPSEVTDGILKVISVNL
ncbi:type II toxin-antitoxin system HicB family antitoxin [Streptococcus sp. 20-1249]|uniref:type II toxin-antitoxin system HicB family antitoxin n=1 Tax=Streptococcus hepaticus TaxID=3349163 RepID=UPI0037478BC4